MRWRAGRSEYKDSELTLYTDLVKIDTNSVIHELGHRFEHEVNGLRELNHTYLMDRVKAKYDEKGGILKPEGELVDINTLLPPDKQISTLESVYSNTGFCTDYMAKPNRFRHTEVLSVGADAVIRETWPIWKKDIESVNYILGLLGAL